ncbi:MFS transporter [Rhizobium sullae]|uniref:MFS transporter n=1 Tax=Rhizobium sullae TaxID=50338 RepID=UPI001FD4F43B|nr:MFS transporter [Rhizobium sullae]
MAGHDLALSPVEFGWLASAFFASFALLQIPVGIAFDRWGARWPMTLMMIAGAAVGKSTWRHIATPHPLRPLRARLSFGHLHRSTRHLVRSRALAERQKPFQAQTGQQNVRRHAERIVTTV